jgi:hypothetical protein
MDYCLSSIIFYISYYKMKSFNTIVSSSSYCFPVKFILFSFLSSCNLLALDSFIFWIISSFLFKWDYICYISDSKLNASLKNFYLKTFNIFQFHFTNFKFTKETCHWFPTDLPNLTVWFFWFISINREFALISLIL